MEKLEPVIGQEAVVPKYGLGRVTKFALSKYSGRKFIAVKPYVHNYPIEFDPDNVKLIKINFENLSKGKLIKKWKQGKRKTFILDSLTKKEDKDE